MRSRSRSVLATVWMCAVTVPLLFVLLGGQPATSIAAGSAGSGKDARRPVPAGKLVAKYTTADSDTYRLPDGHMVTRVYERPINRRDAAGQWQSLTEKQSAGAKAQAEASPELSATPDAERNPLGQENEAACTLTSTAPTTSACNELTFKAGYETSSKAARRALVQFALPDLHEESTILSAQLELYAAKTTTSTGVAMGAYRVTTPWTTKATWNTSNGSTAWHTPGGDYANPEKESDAAINTSVGAKTGWTYWYPTQMVQEWYNGTDAPNGQGQPDLGFLLKDVSEGATNNVVTFDGREEREHDPGLTLEWVQRGVGNATNYTQLPTQLSSTQSLDVNPASGNLSIHSTDLQIASKGLAFESARTWNSLRNEAPDYGYGWVDSNAVYIEALAGGNVAYTDGSGNTFPFIKEAAEKFKTPSGIEATMCEAKSASPCPATLPSGVTYQLIYSKTGERINFGHKESFEPFVYYYVVSAEDSAGEKQTAQYTGAMEYPTSWIDTEKTEIAYTESAATGYTKITAKTSPVRSTSYVEPEGEDGLYHLTVYTNEKGEKTTYRYGGESYLEGNLLTEITEPNGAVTKLSYNSDYQVTKVVLIASGQKTGPTTAYTYYELGKAPAPCTTTQKATLITETEGNEEPQLLFCANVLDEVENVVALSETGQSGWYAFEDGDVSATERASVNLATGNLLVKAEDVTPESTDAGLAVDRYYNSQATSSGPLGAHWSWGTGPNVRLHNYGPLVVLHGASGYAVVFKQTSATTYAAPGESEGTLTKNANGTFTLTEEAAPTYQFSAAGVLTSETTPEGASFTVADTTLAGKSVLHSLTPTSGKPFEVTYNEVPQVTQTTDPAGRVRKYGFNTSKELSSYTNTTGAKTEYGYTTTGYLDKITTPEGVETITTVNGKVSEVSFTPTGGEASGDKFSYQTPTSPGCNPATATYETIVTQEPSGSTETLCYTSLGQFTGPKSENENAEEGTGTPPEVPAGTCEEDSELHKEDCAYEEEPPEATEDLPTADYGIADNNWLLLHEPTKRQQEEKKGAHAYFNYFASPFFKELQVKWVRRTVPWNMVIEAEHDEELAEDNPGALQELQDVEEWIKQVKASGAQPFVSFDDECPAPAPTWAPPGKLNGKQYPCSLPPTKAQYKAGVELFLHPKANHAILGEVTNFAALNEPNNGQDNVAKERLKPTWSPEKSSETYGLSGAELAGQYWRALSDLCATSVRKAEKRAPCYVSAGEFFDSFMPNADTNNNNPLGGYAYFQGYVKGMGHPLSASRWAWHAYEDAENTQVKYHGGSPKKWWSAFHNFEKAIDNVEKHSAHPHPNILLTEQGVLYFYGNHVTPGGAWENKAHAENIMDAYVKHRGQLTNQPQITRFFYYSMRGEPGFDSGLLEAAQLPEKETPKTGVSQPREIYRIYKQKTPGG